VIKLDLSHGSGTLWLSSLLGVPVKLLVGCAGPQGEDLHSTNDSPSQFETVAVCRETYALLSPVTETDDRGTHAEKKGPLHYVNLDRSEERKVRLANRGNGTVLDPSITPTSTSKGNKAVPAFLRTVGQTSTSSLVPWGRGVSVGIMLLAMCACVRDGQVAPVLAEPQSHCYVVTVEDSKGRIATLYTDETFTTVMPNPFVVNNADGKYGFGAWTADYYQIIVRNCP
jgi:hypothetical protein